MNALKEALLETLRLILLAIIPLVIVGLETGGIDWKSIGVLAGTTVLRFVDKWLHEYGKETDDPSMEKGLTRF